MNELTRRLLHEQNECTLCWVMQDGAPAATTVSFVAMDEKVYLTALDVSARVRALARDPRAVLVISGKGGPVGHSRCVSMQGTCDVADDEQTRDKFFPAFARVVLPDSEKGAQFMAQSMNTPENLVLCFTPAKLLPYDAQAMLDQANSL